MANYVWKIDSGAFGSVDYVCGYCGRQVASTVGMATAGGNEYRRAIVCPNCEKVTYAELHSGETWENVRLTPAAPYGVDVPNLPSNIRDAYEEARKSMQAGAFTGAVQLCRTLLSFIAVEKGAKGNQSFGEYAQYLHANHYTPPGSEEWVGHIRKMGNEATHDLRLFQRDEAAEVLDFTEMLLRFNYDYPNRRKQKVLV